MLPKQHLYSDDVVATFWKRVGQRKSKARCWIFKSQAHKRQCRVFNGVFAHRYSYELFHGPIPKRMMVRQTCGVHECINPWHLEVARRPNTKAHITHCPKGHFYGPLNTRIDKRGHRLCKQCAADGRKRKARFWKKVDRRGPSDCWLWLAGTVGRYGCFENWYAHRLAYRLTYGKIPEGHVVTHKKDCPHSLCCNPAHLEAVSPSEINRRRPRKARCKHGHPFDEKNTFIDYRGNRGCLECQRRCNRICYAKKKLAAGVKKNAGRCPL